MKKRNIFIGIAILATIVALFLFYQRMINVFDEDTIVSMTVTSEDGLTTKFYEFDEKQLRMLSNNLNSAMKTDLSTEGAKMFKVTLLNKWDISDHHYIYMHENGDILIQNEKKENTKFLTTALFFKSHEAFDAYYEKNYFPEVSIKLNNEEHPYSLLNHQWFFKRLNLQWAQKNTSFKAKDIEAVDSKSAEDKIYIFSEKPVTKLSYKIIQVDTGMEIKNETATDTLPVPEFNGSYQYTVDMEWSDDKALYKGNATLEFTLNVKQPPKLTLKENILEQGKVFVIEATNLESIEDLKVEQKISDKANWFYGNNKYTYLIPTNYDTITGDQTIKITHIPDDSVQEFLVNVQERTFKTQQLVVDPNIESEKRTEEAMDEFKDQVLPLLAQSSGEKYYEDKDLFIIPSKGRLTTEFGEMRSVNGALTTYRHSGIDIAAKTGTPVLATNKGKVVFAKPLTLTGNTIVIDHGHGIFSLYEHLDKINVNVGDLVDTTTEIGTIGNTGFSTGAHLHFSLCFQEVYIEPGHFIFGEAITKEKYPTLN